MEGMEEGASGALLRERTGERGEEMEGAWEGGVREQDQEFAPYSGKIGVATRPEKMGPQPWVILREGRWASEAFMGYVRSTIEYPLWVSRVLVGRKKAPSRQPGQGTKWGRER